MAPHTTAQRGLSVAAAATRAGVNPATLRDAISRGDIAATRILLLKADDVDRWAASQDKA